MIEQFLKTVSHLPEQEVPAGKIVLRQGERRGQLWVLTRGSVEILKDDTAICKVKDRGAVFGEMSVLLRTYQLASVKTVEPSAFVVIEDAEQFLAGNSEAAVLLAKMLAKRLALLDSNFSKVKQDLEKMKEGESDTPKPAPTGTQLVGRFLADAERTFRDPYSMD